MTSPFYRTPEPRRWIRLFGTPLLIADFEAAFPHEYRRILEDMISFERGIQAFTELGDFHAALNLCDRAIALKLGEHYEAKRDSLQWAR